MNSPYHYDSKFMQALALLADYLILNFLYVLLCIPIFTIGAAQAGLYNGLRILTSKENESSCIKAFFRGFRNGFGKITLVWGVVSVITLFLGYNILAVYVFKTAGYSYSTSALVFSIIGTSIAAVYQSMLTLFHAFFDCTIRQLIRNVFLVIMANPLRSIAVTLLVWAPIILSVINFVLFLQMAFLLVFLYYSIALSVSVRLMSAPFQRLIDNLPQE